MEIYIANVMPLMEDKVFQELEQLIPRERRDKNQRYYKKEDRCRGLGAGLLLEYGLRRRGLTLLEDVRGKRRAALELGQQGKPGLRNVTGLHFNLSHAGDYAAAVFSETAVGIDIERIGEAKLDLARRFFTGEECEFLESLTGRDTADREFIRIWTRKESYIKAVGRGMSLPLDSFSVLEQKVYGEQTYHLYSWDAPDGYFLSVCAGEKISAQIEQIELQTAFGTGGIHV